MSEERSSHTAGDYAYPDDLARFVEDRWADVPELPGGPLVPDAATLEAFFSGCYHASMLHEEARPVTFRAILAAPDRFELSGVPPEALLPLEFSRSLAFTPNELRRLSVATDPQRTLIAVSRDGRGDLRIWGLVDSGAQWLRHVQGGRRPGPSLPLAPVAYARAPGHIDVYKDHVLVGKLQRGHLSGSRVDLFESNWLPAQFTRFFDEILERHKAARKHACGVRGETWAPIEPSLPHRVARRMLKRVIAVLRDTGHGGTVTFIPADDERVLCGEAPYIDLRYRFTHGRSQLRFPDLIVELLNRLSQIFGTSEARRPSAVGWREFETTSDDRIGMLDAALFEVAHVIADLAATDGAVVLSKRNEVLGFGGMISGRLPGVKTVARALDLEGEQVVEEEVGNIGARHRSAYRLAGALPNSVTIVISQDGGVRFVTQKRGQVTYWEQE